MKILYVFIFLLVSSCAVIEVHPVGHIVDLSKVDLNAESKKSFRESKVDDYVPTELERNDYYKSLEDSIAYKNYLLLECASILKKDQGLDLNKPVYASLPKWNNTKNYFVLIFNFQSTKKELPVENTMECDLAVNAKKEVAEYQIKKSYRQLLINE